MTSDILETRKHVAAQWFRQLRDQICERFENIEEQLNNSDKEAGVFQRKCWDRTDAHTNQNGGGGEMSLMHGRVFEKVGVNISTVHGRFSDDFAKKIPGADKNNGQFWAAGISLVAHMQSPKVPAVHMNTRMIVTDHAWFGGGADLTPMVPNDDDTQAFHDAFRYCCEQHSPEYYPKFKQWCDEYFYLKHRNEQRGVGGIFYDYLNNDWDADFTFTKDVGRTFLETYPKIVEAHMHDTWNQEEREHQLMRRGRYVEFNLLYDRGTIFGLNTGGNVDAILMSLPPAVTWP